MDLLVVASSAVRSLRRAPVRSALTGLGIIVGVAALIATASIGSGANKKIQETLARPESRSVFLSAVFMQSLLRQIATGQPPPRSENLRSADYEAIRTRVEGISGASPRIISMNRQARSVTRAVDVTLEGIDVDGFDVPLPRHLLEGALFSRLDVLRNSNVCVISKSLSSLLYPQGRRGSEVILVRGVPFTVIGVVDDEQNGLGAELGDLHIYVPFTSLLRRIDPGARFAISVQAKDIEHVSVVRQQIDDVMEQRRGGRRVKFLTNTAESSIRAYTEGSLTAARLLAVMAAIALTVGGIGIMNIMLVSVSERTREIGIRAALGTRSRDIMSQFLMEATLLSLVGGLVGIALGWVASRIVTQVNGWPTELTIESVVTASLCSLAIGVFFGYHPARRAASVSPVLALRAEP